jgi:hypothetical protein
MTRRELLDAWDDAVTAAELAERLATSAMDALERAYSYGLSAQELGVLAERVAASADHAATAARRAGRLVGEAAEERDTSACVTDPVMPSPPGLDGIRCTVRLGRPKPVHGLRGVGGLRDQAGSCCGPAGGPSEPS